ncbi:MULTISPECIES: LysR family transcriptional regulator [unclassified Variovorax]|uniref:LysR family transcriptional regulator n=1 Tax=unclassified Variovorax TaxID=663243 RepID=UPI0008B30F15|nr:MULTISPECIES: LysR family transcriptional regulator [unclassified Variovorax]SEJ27231.1 DNA-binding transcriptional regulator, LysR family [Variovorax sp. OK202]SFC20358.1 DNA-binding transcriptional regulator, LysR family [Variovorax sp. OK212]
MSRIDLALVEAFVLVATSGSLTRAESLSGTSKATLSRQLVRLEELLGAQLLMRGSRRITLTEAGRAFFSRAEGLLDEVTGRLEAASTEIHELTTGVSGSLSLLSDTQFSTSFVCHVVKLFLESHPNVRCQLDVANGFHAARIADVDCYVCSEPPDAPNLVAKLLGRLNYGLYASPQYLARHGTPSLPQELARHQSIVMKAPSSGGAQVLLVSGAQSFAFRPEPAFETNDHWVMKTFCIDGLGIALLPAFFVKPEVAQGVLAPVLPAWQPEPRRIYCAYQRQRYMGQKLRAFVDLMARCVVDIDSYNYYVGSSAAKRRKTAARP